MGFGVKKERFLGLQFGDNLMMVCWPWQQVNWKWWEGLRSTRAEVGVAAGMGVIGPAFY